MSETTQNAPAEVLFQPEAELLAVANIADIDHFRVITKDGKSLKATPAQVREMVGVDYSKLEEQIVPGEYWLGTDGVKKQVYTKTIIMTVPSTFTQGAEIAAGINGVREILSIRGNIRIGDNDAPIDNYFDVYVRGDAYSGSTRLVSKTSATADKKIVLTLLYTKR